MKINWEEWSAINNLWAESILAESSPSSQRLLHRMCKIEIPWLTFLATKGMFNRSHEILAFELDSEEKEHSIIDIPFSYHTLTMNDILLSANENHIHMICHPLP
jgi:hypothetical protein